MQSYPSLTTQGSASNGTNNPPPYAATATGPKKARAKAALEYSSTPGHDTGIGNRTKRLLQTKTERNCNQNQKQYTNCNQNQKQCTNKQATSWSWQTKFWWRSVLFARDHARSILVQDEKTSLRFLERGMVTVRRWYGFQLIIDSRRAVIRTVPLGLSILHDGAKATHCGHTHHVARTFVE